MCHMLYKLTDSMALDQRRQVMKTFCSESGGDSSAYCSAVVILITTNEVIDSNQPNKINEQHKSVKR